MLAPGQGDISDIKPCYVRLCLGVTDQREQEYDVLSMFYMSLPAKVKGDCSGSFKKAASKLANSGTGGKENTWNIASLHSKGTG